ncbi:MAG: NUDIX domain-containing protein [Myxococcota bacterium]
MADAGAPRHAARLATAAFVCSGSRVLLMRHPATSDRFAGRWNGIGGHVAPGEGIRAAARRELREEAGLDVPELRLRGVVHETGLLGHAHVIFFFVADVSEPHLTPALGLELAWHERDRLSELPLVDDLHELLPALLATSEPVLAVERFDGADRRVGFAWD